jgi:hypothetical protein
MLPLKLIKKGNTFDEFGSVIENAGVELDFFGTFQYMENEILIRTHGIDITTKVYKLVTRETLEIRDVINHNNDFYEVIENRNSLYTDAQVYLVKNIQRGEYV